VAARAWLTVWALVVGLGAGIALRLSRSRSRWGWLAAATTVVISLPRLFVYDVTYLMIGAEGRRAEAP